MNIPVLQSAYCLQSTRNLQCQVLAGSAALPSGIFFQMIKKKTTNICTSPAYALHRQYYQRCYQRRLSEEDLSLVSLSVPYSQVHTWPAQLTGQYRCSWAGGGWWVGLGCSKGLLPFIVFGLSVCSEYMFIHLSPEILLGA